jgi:hypothetical protein
LYTKAFKDQGHSHNKEEPNKYFFFEASDTGNVIGTTKQT